MFGRVTTVSALVAAAWFAASCTESAGPAVGTKLPQPLFSYSASGITLDRVNGDFNNQSGDSLVKGFDPISPHNGDAVIATFYWPGSTNIITSVFDFKTDAEHTRIGNTYHLVQYVTAGGLSMATYVATNIQGFTDAGSNPVYGVGAKLSQPVTGGGIRISAWTGVQDVYAQAIGTGAGAPRSAFGTGTAPTPASAGSIAYNAGALVHAASVVIPPVGVDIDQAFLDMGVGGSPTMKDDAVYAVPGSSGTANPQWTWYFDSTGGTWLATSLTLNAAPLPPPPSVSISGPQTLTLHQSGQYFANVSGGASPFTYEWRDRNCWTSGGCSAWQNWFSTGSQNYTFASINGCGLNEIDLESRVTDALSRVGLSSTYIIHISNPC